MPTVVAVQTRNLREADDSIWRMHFMDDDRTRGIWSKAPYSQPLGPGERSVTSVGTESYALLAERESAYMVTIALILLTIFQRPSGYYGYGNG
jgi:hypothetical protein